MKKILLTILLITLAGVVVAQTGSSWSQQRAKVNFKDSTYFAKGISQAEIRHLDDSLLVRFTKSQDTTFTAAIINDTITQRLADAVLGVAVLDSINNEAGNPEYYATPYYVRGYIGSGGGGSFTGEILKFIIGTTTGAPSAGDSIIVHSAFENKQVDVYRRGDLHWFHTSSVNTRDSSYRINADTIFVKPDWTDDEWIEIRIREPISWDYLSLEGQESDLTDSLVVFYKCDDAAGSSIVDDAMDVQDGVLWSPATAGESGRYNYGKHITYKRQVTVALGSDASPSGADFSVSMWFKLDADSVGDIVGRNMYLWSQKHTATMPDGTLYSHRLYIDGTTADSNKVIFTSYNDDVAPVKYSVESSVKINSDQWYCVTAVNPGNGGDLVLYIDGADVSADAGTFTGTVFQGLSTTYFGNVNYNYPFSFPGYIDEIGIWKDPLSAGDALLFYNIGKTHPWE